jgi:hypothetical protein
MENQNDSASTPTGPQSVRSKLAEPSQDALIERLSHGKGKKYGRFVLAVLSSIPWVGGVISAAANLSAEKDQEHINELQKLWLEEHKGKIKELGETLNEIFMRLDNFGNEVEERIQSPEYLALVKKSFRLWDEADTNEKKQMFKKLITNAGAITLCSDDLVRLFIHWIDQYHESYFSVIKEIYRNPRITRGTIWDRIYEQRPREDSAEADLFRYLIRELSTGGVIRQERETDMQGRSVKKDTRGQSHESSSRVMESAFEDTKPYVLTELGRQFVHYVMEDVVPQLGSTRPSP